MDSELTADWSIRNYTTFLFQLKNISYIIISLKNKQKNHKLDTSVMPIITNLVNTEYYVYAIVEAALDRETIISQYSLEKQG